MMFSKKPFTDKRRELRDKLKSQKCLRFVGAFSPLVARLIEEKGFDGVYVSGAVVSNDRGWPDVGLTTLNEVVDRASNIAQSSFLPSIVDVDTGFGESMNCARSLVEMERGGLSGLHIEDQEFPKRCGHLDNKKLISMENMVLKIQSIVKARRDKNFLIIARTDAKSVSGMEEAIDRAKAYLEAGADMIFPESLSSIKEFEEFRLKVPSLLLANMTEFGKTDIISHKIFEKMGYNIVIYPVTTWRLALKAVEKGLDMLFKDQQASMLDQMQTRKRLYELLRYEDYKLFDKGVFDFKINRNKT